MKNKIYQIGLGLMLLVNGILIFLFVQGAPRPPRHDRSPKQNGLMEKISQQLQLTPEQQANYFELAKAHATHMNVIDKSHKKLLKTYFKSLILPSEQQPNHDQLLHQIQSLEAQKITITYQHFHDLKALCNESQKAHFELIINDMFDVLIRNSKNNPPPPRD
ncbi:periplasmic heavy metal sensor [Reichenbachiella carrageenanivorans]|uniref:Periplasmic heavy metal sensor n=1 Tax=Reichenbachiella carrageenanivorans TaxID=2979869 RepID=A0ABY6CZ51_9BACT|nr:periplasmic heavy metal sensor [Reichenbachiella carrageenanivorans]UXX79196.1 periplasmic heavy metal sensor [Reichenbachiella carrageenanivorans]